MVPLPRAIKQPDTPKNNEFKALQFQRLCDNGEIRQMNGAD
jgi:hypothetical protein